MCAKQSSMHLTLPMEERESLKESLAQLNSFLSFFPAEKARSTLWMMLFDSLSGQGADGWTAQERSMALYFYDEYMSLCSHLVKIDQCLEKMEFE